MFDVYFHTAASQPCARQCFRLESSSSCWWNSVSGFVTIPSLALRKRGCKIAATATHSRARSISSGLRFLGRDLGDVLVFTTKNSFEQKHMLVARPMMSLLSSLLTGTPPRKRRRIPGLDPDEKRYGPLRPGVLRVLLRGRLARINALWDPRPDIGMFCCCPMPVQWNLWGAASKLRIFRTIAILSLAYAIGGLPDSDVAVLRIAVTIRC